MVMNANSIEADFFDLIDLERERVEKPREDRPDNEVSPGTPRGGILRDLRAGALVRPAAYPGYIIRIITRLLPLSIFSVVLVFRRKLLQLSRVLWTAVNTAEPSSHHLINRSRL